MTDFYRFSDAWLEKEDLPYIDSLDYGLKVLVVVVAAFNLLLFIT